MSFIHVRGPAKNEPFAKLASTAIAVAAALSFKGASGYVSQALVASVRIAGVSLGKVASTDDDFASNTIIPVIIPGEEDVFEATVSGTATQANVGRQYDLTQTAGGTAQAVDLSGTTYKVVTVVGFISSSKVLVKFNGNYVFANKAN